MCKKLNDFKENNGSLFLNVNLFFKYNTDRRKKKKMWYIYNGILLSHKKEQNNAICSNMDATRDYHTK